MTMNAHFDGNQRFESFFCQMDFENEKYQFLAELPNYTL
jgi:hypothetical protein